MPEMTNELIAEWDRLVFGSDEASERYWAGETAPDAYLAGIAEDYYRIAA